MGFFHSLGSKLTSAGSFIGKKVHEGLKYGVKHAGKIAEVAGKVSHVAGRVGDMAGSAAGVVAATGIGNAGLSEALAGVAAAGKGVEAAVVKFKRRQNVWIRSIRLFASLKNM